MIKSALTRQSTYHFIHDADQSRGSDSHLADLNINKPELTVCLKATDLLIASKQSEIRSLEYFLNMGQLVVMLSDLVHAIQKERGASNLYLGSDGQHFADDLTNYIHETDQKIIEFDGVLRKIYPEVTTHAGNGRLLNRIAYTLHALAGLPQFRAQVRQLRIETDAVIQVYSETIGGLLTIVFETADAAVDPTIARILVALFNLMHGKELTGQERALGVAGFASAHFSMAQREQLQYLLDGQERCFELFYQFADSASIKLCEQYAHAPAMNEIRRLRQLALDQQSNLVEAQHGDEWFRLLTQHIDHLKTVELGLQMYLQKLCEQRVNDAQQCMSQQQDLINTLDMHTEETLILFQSLTPSPKPHATLAQDNYHLNGLGPRLGRSVFELVQNQAQRLQQMQDELIVARTAIEDRKLQEKAKLLLMKNRKLTEDQAHKFLRQMAMNQGKRITEVAQSIVDMVQF